MEFADIQLLDYQSHPKISSCCCLPNERIPLWFKSVTFLLDDDFEQAESLAEHLEKNLFQPQRLFYE